ncbi:unnamed protein product [Moneuplotes crassus]|uniref:Uncharacterized protein n=1 Tax=Euplotes crassus TaxID=5936 RepID=A0AAD1XX11_EUPCR|nr:unnamed protein product [Moneuplotes crassus]
MQTNSAKKTDTDKEVTPKYIKKGSKEFSAFIWFLGKNFEKANSKSLCLELWCLCNRYQMMVLKDKGNTLLTPRYYRDEATFIALAMDNNRYIRYKDGSIGFQPFVTHQHVIPPDSEPKALKFVQTKEERKKKDISELQAKRMRDNLIGERDIFTMYGYDEANELNNIIKVVGTLKDSQDRIRSRIASIGKCLDLLVETSDQNPGSLKQ